MENIKSFLRINNVIVVMAADMDKIESAWQLQFRCLSDDPLPQDVGRDYTEKMFQMNLNLPVKSEPNLNTYLSKLSSSLGDKNVEYFIKNMPPNPRKIKLAVNKLYFILDNAPDIPPYSGYNEEDFLHAAITWISIASNHKEIAEIAKLAPSYLVYAAYVCSNFEHLDNYKYIVGREGPMPRDNVMLPNGFAIISADYMSYPLAEILKMIATTERPAFKILKHYGLSFKLRAKEPNGKIRVAEEHKDLFDPYFKALSYMVHNVMI